MKISNAQSLLSAPNRIAKQCVSVALAIALLALSATVVAEEGKTLDVCIPQHTAKDALLSQLANTLSHHTPDANTHTRLMGVQLASIDQILVTDNPFKGNQPLRRCRTSCAAAPFRSTAITFWSCRFPM